MENTNKEEIRELVGKVLSDYDGDKYIDTTDIFNKPDRNEVINIINNLFFVVYPGYFKDLAYKFYDPKNSIAVVLEDIFYNLNGVRIFTPAKNGIVICKQAKGKVIIMTRIEGPLTTQ